MVLLHIVIYVLLSSCAADRQKSRQIASHTETHVDVCVREWVCVCVRVQPPRMSTYPETDAQPQTNTFPYHSVMHNSGFAKSLINDFNWL